MKVLSINSVTGDPRFEYSHRPRRSFSGCSSRFSLKPSSKQLLLHPLKGRIQKTTGLSNWQKTLVGTLACLVGLATIAILMNNAGHSRDPSYVAEPVPPSYVPEPVLPVISNCLVSDASAASALAELSARAKMEGEILRQVVDQALEEGGWIEWGGEPNFIGFYLYLVKNKMGEVIASFKPEDERYLGPNCRNPSLRRDSSYEEILKQNVWDQGLLSERQDLTNRLDLGNVARAPAGCITTLESDQFFDKNETGDAQKKKKTGYLQAWVSNAPPLWKAGSKERANTNLGDYPLLNNVPINEIQKVGILDFISFNADRTANNVLISTDSDGIPHLIPIDHDRTFPSDLQLLGGSIFMHSVAEKPFTQESLRLIDDLESGNVRELIMKQGLPEQVARNTKALIMTLRSFSKDPRLTLIDIYRFAQTNKSTDGTDYSTVGSILSEVNKKVLVELKLDENEIESIKLRLWTSPNTISDQDRRTFCMYDESFWTTFQNRIDEEVQKISLKIL